MKNLHFKAFHTSVSIKPCLVLPRLCIGCFLLVAYLTLGVSICCKIFDKNFWLKLLNLWKRQPNRHLSLKSCAFLAHVQQRLIHLLILTNHVLNAFIQVCNKLCQSGSWTIKSKLCKIISKYLRSTPSPLGCREHFPTTASSEAT